MHERSYMYPSPASTGSMGSDMEIGHLKCSRSCRCIWTERVDKRARNFFCVTLLLQLLHRVCKSIVEIKFLNKNAYDYKMPRKSQVTRRPKNDEAIVTSDVALKEEVRRAEVLCREEEEACSDAESLDDTDYLDDESESSDGSYESDFIDDDEVDEKESRIALNSVRKIAGRLHR